LPNLAPFQYFTLEKCADVARENLTMANDALAFTHAGNNSIALQLLLTSKPLKNVV